MDVEQIAPGLWHWTAQHPDWNPRAGWGQVVSSYALVGDEALLLFDPLVPDDEPDRFWEALDRDVDAHGPPEILITIFWHARSTQQILDRYGKGTAWWYEPALKDVGDRVRDPKTFVLGDELPGGVQAADMRQRVEVAYWLPNHYAVVIGDTLLGDGENARLCPESWLDDGDSMDEVLDAVKRLLDRQPSKLLLTHGGPTEPSALEV